MAEWKFTEKDLKHYPHFDQILKLDEIQAIVTDPTRVSQNAFYPLLCYSKRWQPFRRKSSDEKSKPKPKIRLIRYAARRDAYIFMYYRSILSELYEAELRRLGINHCPIAYRRIPMNDNSKRGKSNIQFSREAIDCVRKLKNCCVIAIDISKFFESIDHVRLKTLWCRLLNKEKLPQDHFAVFKNITRYHSVDKLKAYERLGFYGVKGIKKNGDEIKGYLTPYREVPTQLCSGRDFRQKILGENYEAASLVETNQTAGIPQGAPISDLLANISLINFDVEMNQLTKNVGGTYFRYSDDILLILPISSLEAISLMNSMPRRIKIYGDKLEIKIEKAFIVQYVSIDNQQIAKHIAGSQGKHGLEYLGFRYDGKNIFIRDTTLSNLYRKVTSKARSHARATVRRYPGKTDMEIQALCNFEEFMKRFGRIQNFESALSKKNWTFWTYVVRATEEFGLSGRTINRQVRKLRKHARHHMNIELADALQRRAKDIALASG